MSDLPLEDELFALYGEPAQEWGEGGVTAGILARVRPRRALRLAVLVGSVVIGLCLLGAGIFTTVWPELLRIAADASIDPARVWTAGAVSLLMIGAVATHLALCE